MTNPKGARTAIDGLLKRGLDLYGRNDVEQAVQCWRQVLALSPNDQQAIDYLECAGASPEPLPGGAEVIDLDRLRAHPPAIERAPFGDSNAPAATDERAEHDIVFDDESSLPPGVEGVRRKAPSSPTRRFIENLLRNGRYEEALAMLYQARASNPSDPKLSKSIRLMRERLVLHYTSELDNLDLVPVANGGVAPRPEDGAHGDALHEDDPVSQEERQVLGLIDGISNYGDIVSTCSLGRLATLRILCKLQAAGLLQRQEEPPSESQSIPKSHAPDADGDSFPREAEPAPEPAPEVDGYAQLFSEATTAYLVRDLKRAEELFEQCHRERPEDRRVLHNLNALRRKLNQ